MTGDLDPDQSITINNRQQTLFDFESQVKIPRVEDLAFGIKAHIKPLLEIKEIECEEISETDIPEDN